MRERAYNRVVVIVDNIRSLNNIGSLFRTADAFGVEAIALCGICGTPPHREIQKTALGATRSVPWNYYEKTMSAVKRYSESGYKIVAVEQTGDACDLARFPFEERGQYALIFGHEINGVAPDVIEASDLSLQIPQFGIKRSLNVAVTAGIVLWEFCGKRCEVK